MMAETRGVLQIKRIYDAPEDSDGFRVLVDRLWPRGVAKSKAAIDLWDKDIAPSPDLRTWWNHDPERFEEFSRRYRIELDSNTTAVDALMDLIKAHPAVTLLYGARDHHINHAEVLRRYIEDLM